MSIASSMSLGYFVLAASPSSSEAAYDVVWTPDALSFVLDLSVVFGIICKTSLCAPSQPLLRETEFACAGRIRLHCCIVLGKHDSRMVIFQTSELCIH